MITGDYNIVDVEFFVEYKVSDPEKYLYGSHDPRTNLGHPTVSATCCKVRCAT